MSNCRPEGIELARLADIVDLPVTSCFACGAARQGIVAPCGACGRSPNSQDEWRRAITSGGYVAVDTTKVHTPSSSKATSPVYQAIQQRALENVVMDSQLRDLVQGPARQPGAQSTAENSEPVNPAGAVVDPDSWSLLNSPFFLARASQQDSAEKIRSSVSKLALSDASSAAALVDSLVDPAQRLHAELQWLGDIDWELAQACVDGEELKHVQLAPHARINLECERLHRRAGLTADLVASSVIRADKLLAHIDPDALMQSLNLCRRAAGIDEVADQAAVSEALDNRMHELSAVFVRQLDKLSTDELLQCFEQFCDVARTPNFFIRSLVNHYRKFADPVLVSEGDKVVALSRRGANTLRHNGVLAAGYVERMTALLSVYHRVLKPIRTSGQGLGVARTLSQLMRDAFGELCEAAQQYGDADTASALSSLQSQYFRRR